MLKLRQGIIELYRKVATSLPPDVEAALSAAWEAEEEGSEAKRQLGEILEDTKRARQKNRPLCLASGIPVFYVKIPRGLSHNDIKETLIQATRDATVKIPLSSNAVDVLTSVNTGNNTGAGFPIIYLEESPDSTLTVELMLRGSRGENESHTFRLPDSELEAERDLDGVAKCVVEAVRRAGAKGCPPYTVGVGVGGGIDQATQLSRQQLRRKLSDTNPNPALEALEEKALKDINALGIGVSGLGGKTTALGVKIGVGQRHPDSYIVDVALACWSNRRGKLIW